MTNGASGPMMPAPQTIEIGREADIYRARQVARLAAQKMGFSSSSRQEVELAVSEVASNMLRHARGGRVTVGPASDGGRRGIVIVASDDGPGIPDPEAALRGGFSTGGGLGVGLSSCTRLMSEVKVETALGFGTTVRMWKWRSG